MPIYEFVCTACRRKSSFLTRSVHSPLEPVCASCGSTSMEQALSSFAYHGSAKDVHQAYGPPPDQTDFDYYKDPHNIGRNVEETFQRWNKEVPKDIQDTIDAAREGTMPEGLDI